MFLDLDARESKFEKERTKRAVLARQKQEDSERSRREYERHQRELEGPPAVTSKACGSCIMNVHLCML